MEYITDMHLHSRYSRATSRDLNIEGLYKGARLKGIDIIGTGDFTFPAYIQEMEKELEPVGGGLYSFKRKSQVGSVPVKNDRDPKFIITTEISNIYKRHGKVRRIHTVIVAPGLDEVKKLNKQLDKIGNIKSDGRPILGMDVADMAKIIWGVSEDFIIIPAHAWTPWFAIFGSKSGFDSIEECFGDLTPKIYAIETGLSSDPAMNWRLSQLDNISIVSNSDAHSLPNLGREATVFELEAASIANIKTALRKGASTKNRLAYTIEFYPQEGKYHYDGHRDCKFVCDPKETKRLKGICPKCKKPLTVGVDYRVSELADREEPKKFGEFKYIVPLQEIIADAFAQKKGTKRVQETYGALIASVADEFTLLLKTPLADIEAFGISEIAEGVRRVREGEVHIEPGYDGEYGVVSVFRPDEQISAKSKQKTLF
ncbi:MAG: DNA helicase UvrD [Parcubacteria group bacterium]|nr:DNA helicase UvrD [Candidatus Vogelbacteria bacterium]MBI2050936.1 DNA helicase UvrD [Parcubacteria group bacterium]